MIMGPLTEAELRAIINTVKDIEERRPDETFAVHIDAPDAEEFMEDFLSRINNLRPGYGRRMDYFRLDGDQT
jgi:hypothetical protein